MDIQAVGMSYLWRLLAPKIKGKIKNLLEFGKHNSISDEKSWVIVSSKT